MNFTYRKADGTVVPLTGDSLASDNTGKTVIMTGSASTAIINLAPGECIFAVSQVAPTV